MASDVATNAGAIGAVQVRYADDEPGLTGTNPAKAVALVQNASGDFTAPTMGGSSSKGQTMSEFINYALTLGQQEAPSFGYASLGLSLEQYGINVVQSDVPGAVPPTDAEDAALACGDLTPAEVAAGQTTPTCGVVNQNPPPVTPEVPYAVALPGLTLAIFGGAYAVRRRRFSNALDCPVIR